MVVARGLSVRVVVAAQGISRVVVVAQGLCGCALVAAQGVGAQVVVARAVWPRSRCQSRGDSGPRPCRARALCPRRRRGGSGPRCRRARVWWPRHHRAGALWNLSATVTKWAVCLRRRRAGLGAQVVVVGAGCPLSSRGACVRVVIVGQQFWARMVVAAPCSQVRGPRCRRLAGSRGLRCRHRAGTSCLDPRDDDDDAGACGPRRDEEARASTRGREGEGLSEGARALARGRGRLREGTDRCEQGGGRLRGGTNRREQEDESSEGRGP